MFTSLHARVWAQERPPWQETCAHEWATTQHSDDEERHCPACGLWQERFLERDGNWTPWEDER